MACLSFRALMFWCREMLLLLFCQQQQQQQQQWQQPSSISHQFPQMFSSSGVSEVTLGTFSVRFCGLFVLPCLAVLVPGRPAAATAAAVYISHQFPQVFSCSKGSRSHVRDFFGAILGPVRPSVPFCFGAGRCFWSSSSSSSSSSNGSSLVSLISSLSHQFPQVFSSSRVSEVTLGTFSVRFCGLFVLPGLAILVPGGALSSVSSSSSSSSRSSSSSNRCFGAGRCFWAAAAAAAATAAAV